MEDGNSGITHYRLQWKPEAESWSNQNAIEEVTVQPFGGTHTEITHIISGLSNYSYYSLRVIAVNDEGDSEPSTEHFGMPQEEWLDITDTVVDRNQLTITYERTLDSNSVPDRESFWALVNGAPRDVIGVSISGKSVVLTLDEPPKKSIKATDRVEFRYLIPPAGGLVVKDNDGNYAFSCEFAEPPSMTRNETDPGLVEPVTAEFTMLPASHSGPSNEVIFRIEFSEPVKVHQGHIFPHLLEVTGGEVTSAWWLNRDTTIWQTVLVPSSGDASIAITLPADRACDVQGAPCASGERRLTTTPTATIPAGIVGGRSIQPPPHNPDGAQKEGRSTDPSGDGEQGKSANQGDTPPAAPEDLAAAANDDGSVGLTWTTPGDDSVTGYQILRRRPSEGETLSVYATATDSTETTFTDTDVTPGVLHIYRVKAINDAGESRVSNRAEVTPLEHDANTAATGQPAITGTPQLGETLAADTSGISDADGLSNVVFTYQWLVDDASIPGATGSTYTLVDADEGRARHRKGVLRRRRRQRGDVDQRGGGRGSGPLAPAADGTPGERRCVPRRRERLHLRAAFQRGVPPELQDPAGRCVHGDWRDGEEGTATGQAEQHPLADHGRTRLQRRSGHHPAGPPGLRSAGCHLHRGWKEAVRRAGVDRQRSVAETQQVAALLLLHRPS